MNTVDGRVVPYDRFSIRELRERSGLTQTQFAQALGVAPHTYHKWETGERPKPHLLHRLERIESALRDRDLTGWHNLVGMNRTGHALNVRVRNADDQTTIQMGRIIGGLFVPEADVVVSQDALRSSLNDLSETTVVRRSAALSR